MNYSFTGKNTVVSEALKERAIKKIDRHEKLFPENCEVHITFSVVKLENKIEVNVRLPKRLLRAEAVSEDMYAAIDLVSDVLEKQLIKYRKRLKDKSRREPSFKDEFVQSFPTTEKEENELVGDFIVEKNKRFNMKPMDIEEAIMEMELLGHNFFVFKNSKDDTINVIYKRNNGNYGIIEPE